jgi:hypothetical protein
MDNLYAHTAAHAGGTFASATRFLATYASAFWKRLLTALHKSREREAMRVIARYRHLSEEAEEFYQREIEAKRTKCPFDADALDWTDVAQGLYIDPMQGIQ